MAKSVVRQLPTAALGSNPFTILEGNKIGDKSKGVADTLARQIIKKYIYNPHMDHDAFRKAFYLFYRGNLEGGRGTERLRTNWTGLAHRATIQAPSPL